MNLRVEIIKDFEGFSALEAVWNPLLDRSGTDMLFLTFEWLSSCWAHCDHNHQLFIVVVRNGSAIVAIMPLMVVKTKGLRQLCVIDFRWVSDYKDFIIDDSVNREQVIREIFDAIDKDEAWDFFTLDNFPADSVNFLALDSVLARYPSARVIKDKHLYHAFHVSIEGTFEEYFQSLKKSFRESTARHQKNLEKKALSYSFSDEIDSSVISETVGEIIDLNAGKYGSKKDTSCVFDNPLVRSFFIEFAKKAHFLGWLRIPTLFINGEIAARFLDFQYKNKYYYIITCYKPDYSNYSPGRLLNLWLIRRCFELGLNEYDMLTGAEEYKFQYNVKTREKHRFFLFRGGLKGRITRRRVFGSWMPEKLRNIWAVDIMVRAVKKILKKHVSAD